MNDLREQRWKDRKARKPRRSPRTMETIRLIENGLSNKEIGEAMGISTGTVKVYISNSMLGTRYQIMARRIAELERQLEQRPYGQDDYVRAGAD